MDQVIQRAEPGGQHLTGLGAHLTDAQSIDKTAHILLLAGFNGSKELFCRGIALLPQAPDLLQRQIINIGGGFDIPLFNQGIHNGGTEAVNIHGIPADEVGNIPAELGRTFRARTAQERTILVLLRGSAANRANCGQHIGNRPCRPLFKVNVQNFGNNLPCLADMNRVPDADIPLGNEILIVQCSVGNGGTGKTDGSDNRFRRQDTGAAHLNNNILHNRGLDLRGIFIGNGPFWELGSGAHPLALGKVVYFDDGPVDIAGQLRPVFVDGHNFRYDLIRAMQNFERNHLKAEPAQILQRLRVILKFDALRQLDIEHKNIQLPFGGNSGIQLPQRTGGGVAGIGKQGLPLRFLTRIQSLKAFLGHIDLTPDNKPFRSALQCHGDGMDGFQILRHVLAHHAVAPGCAPDEHAVPVLQGHGQAVHLRLHGIDGGSAQGLVHPVTEIRHLAVIEYVL